MNGGCRQWHRDGDAVTGDSDSESPPAGPPGLSGAALQPEAQQLLDLPPYRRDGARVPDSTSPLSPQCSLYSAVRVYVPQRAAPFRSTCLVCASTSRRLRSPERSNPSLCSGRRRRTTCSRSTGQRRRCENENAGVASCVGSGKIPHPYTSFHHAAGLVHAAHFSVPQFFARPCVQCFSLCN